MALEVEGVRLEVWADRAGADWVLDHQTDQEVDLEAYRLQVMAYAWTLGKPKAYVADLRKDEVILAVENPEGEALLRYNNGVGVGAGDGDGGSGRGAGAPEARLEEPDGMGSELYAHSPNAEGRWHPLRHHLEATSLRAEGFTQAFGAPALGRALALFHDLGKAREEFQAYLRAAAQGRRAQGSPHALWGAALACAFLGRCQVPGWEALVLPVLGHHAGLADRGEAQQKLAAALRERQALQGIKDVLQAWGMTGVLAQSLSKAIEEVAARGQGDNGTRLEFLVRMAFSALVDADYLDTEAHFQPQAARRRGQAPTLEEMWRRLQEDQARLLAQARDSLVNRVRREVYEACLEAAELPPGLFRLTVPTGGGKTRSGLAFALKHALRHGLRRVVVAIPYTSIIDQTAQEYRKILGEEAVLEHHSAYEVPVGEEQSEEAIRWRLATENWDFPLVVTTTVQLFESIFANTPAKMRKLHRLARSVILLDEVQALPPELLQPTLEALRLLATPVEEGGYGATVVLSTATQPAFEAIPSFSGLPVREVVPNYPQHFAQLRRVAYAFRREPLSWEALAEELRSKPQVMVVLNARKDALALLEALGDDPHAFHLSALLCPAHRREVLAEVRRRLRSGEPVRLVSTQVVEAGVDLDFPEVWRAVGPLDRVVQAAGRCNREGQQPSGGQVVLFEPQGGRSPSGPYQEGMGLARLLLNREDPERLHDPGLYREYFRRLFQGVNTDAHRIQDLRREMSFPKVAERYRLIRDDTVPVVVPYEGAKEALEAFLAAPSLEAFRALQPYLVNLYRREAHRSPFAEELRPGLFRWAGGYDPRRGIVEAYNDPADLVI